MIRIGNFKGIRLPAAILKQCGIGSKVEIEVINSKIIIKPANNPRDGWTAAFNRTGTWLGIKLQ